MIFNFCKLSPLTNSENDHNLIKKMNFHCEELEINDDADFGVTITFSDTKREYGESDSIEDLLHSTDKYLLIQRSYPEEEGEINWYSIESTESEIELNPKDKIIIKLTQDILEIRWSGELVQIGLTFTEKERNRLETILNRSFKQRLILIK
jgi:hypothetical protein